MDLRGGSTLLFHDCPAIGDAAGACGPGYTCFLGEGACGGYAIEPSFSTIRYRKISGKALHAVQTAAIFEHVPVAPSARRGSG